MKMLIFALAGSLVVLGCKDKSGIDGTSASVAQEEGFILAMEDDVMPVGKVLTSEFIMALEDGKMTVELPDQEVETMISIKQTKSETVEAIGGNKYRHLLTEEKKSEQTTVMGQKQPANETVNPLVGLAVIAERGADGSWTAKLEKGEPTAEMEEKLAEIVKEHEKSTDLEIYGTARRKVGDEWVVTGSDMLGMEGAVGSIKVKLEGIEDFQGERCAKLTGSLDLTGRPEGDAPEGLKMRMTGNFLVFRSLEHRVDLQNKLTGSMEVSGDLEPQPGTKIKMKMVGPIEAVGSAVVSDSK